MDILKMTLSGRTAFFKKPEVNSYVYFTYGCVHKVALMGIFGAILGLNGYGQKRKSGEYPEFYEKLKNLKTGVKCNVADAYIPKKIQIFNNTVGYASKELGGTLNVKEQWLEMPSWDIYVLVNEPVTQHLAEQLLNSSCTYIPYLGKNDHPADITGVKLFKDVKPEEKYARIDSIMEKKKAKFYTFDDFAEAMEEEEDLDSLEDSTYVYRYEEALPVRLSKELQMYEEEEFVATNLWLENYQDEVYRIEGDAIVFF